MRRKDGSSEVGLSSPSLSALPSVLSYAMLSPTNAIIIILAVMAGVIWTYNLVVQVGIRAMRDLAGEIKTPPPALVAENGEE